MVKVGDVVTIKASKNKFGHHFNVGDKVVIKLIDGNNYFATGKDKNGLPLEQYLSRGDFKVSKKGG